MVEGSLADLSLQLSYQLCTKDYWKYLTETILGNMPNAAISVPPAWARFKKGILELVLVTNCWGY